MIVVLLVALGIPIGLALGALGGALWTRRSFRRSPGVFAVKVRGADLDSARWPRRAVYAHWAHDVLIVHQGIALARSRVLPVAGAAELPLAADVGGLGDGPVGVRLQLDDGSLVDVAAAGHDRDALVGPIRERLATTTPHGDPS